MINNFKQFNEGLLDEMKPKSEKEINIAFKDFLSKLKNNIDDENSMISDFFFILEGIYDDKKELLNDLLDEGLDPSDLLVTLIDDLDLKDNPNKSEIRFSKFLKQWMYNLIEKNKENIDFENLF